ncbi:hypothetical protein BT93_L5649 [Corymbia citriodora subsp. variegata]|uniref:Decapping nuclease n=1 Tax=Corymbia citriodora subsp. variegata TaxID=360336 RepID=A0A8T0CJ56_CORYI|nr:hypothetical protein BT93_L5649 [Corymbia citriodora subsp. variegata]
MTAPFSPFDSWEMNLTRFRDTVFIEDNHAFKVASRRKQFTGFPGGPNQDLMSYWGYKFETLSTLPNHWCQCSRSDIEDRGVEIVSNYAQYCSVVRTGFGTVKVLIGGEVDAIEGMRSEDPSRQVPWVELKTSAEITSEKEGVKFERKLLKFWAQSFLLGVPKIVVGFRDQQGTLLRLQEFRTQEIPDMVASRRGLWNGQTCIDFTAGVLDWITDIVVGDGVWRLRKAEKSDALELQQLVDNGTGDILTEEFKHWRGVGMQEMLERIKQENTVKNSIPDTRNTDLQGNGIPNQTDPP